MRSAFGSLLLAFGLAACATRPTPNIDAFAQRSASNSFEPFNRTISSSGLVLAVAHDRQTTPASCGAHALASVINYWRGPNSVTGDALFQTTPPADRNAGYSLAELLAMARQHGLIASPVRLSQQDIVRELENGRPVLAPILVPAVYVDVNAPPGDGVPIVGTVRNVVMARVGRLSEFTHMAMASHYVVVVGYEGDHFVVVEPVMGFRTISFAKLARYRRPFQNAALVLSSPTPPAAQTAAAAQSATAR